MRYIILMLFFLINTQSNAQNNHVGDPNEIAAILSNANKFSSYVVASDYNMISESYTEDAKIFPNNTKIISGKTDITRYWTLPEGMSTVHHQIFPEKIEIVGETAHDYGYYEGKTKHQDGRISSWKGKYVIVWKKVKGKWKMDLDIWNSVK